MHSRTVSDCNARLRHLVEHVQQGSPFRAFLTFRITLPSIKAVTVKHSFLLQTEFVCNDVGGSAYGSGGGRGLLRANHVGTCSNFAKPRIAQPYRNMSSEHVLFNFNSFCFSVPYLSVVEYAYLLQIMSRMHLIVCTLSLLHKLGVVTTAVQEA